MIEREQPKERESLKKIWRGNEFEKDMTYTKKNKLEKDMTFTKTNKLELKYNSSML